MKILSVHQQISGPSFYDTGNLKKFQVFISVQLWEKSNQQRVVVNTTPTYLQVCFKGYDLLVPNRLKTRKKIYIPVPCPVVHGTWIYIKKREWRGQENRDFPKKFFAFTVSAMIFIDIQDWRKELLC